jgi:hypothetical protein
VFVYIYIDTRVVQKIKEDSVLLCTYIYLIYYTMN